MSEASTQIYQHFKSGRPVELELWLASVTAPSDAFRLGFDVDEAHWLALRGLKGERFKAIIYIVPDDEESKPSPPEVEPDATPPAKGEHGAYWQKFRVDVGGVSRLNSPRLRAALGLTQAASENDVWLALRQAFGVTSMTFVSPDQARAWAEEKQILSIMPQL